MPERLTFTSRATVLWEKRFSGSSAPARKILRSLPANVSAFLASATAADGCLTLMGLTYWKAVPFLPRRWPQTARKCRRWCCKRHHLRRKWPKMLQVVLLPAPPATLAAPSPLLRPSWTKSFALRRRERYSSTVRTAKQYIKGIRSFLQKASE